MTDFALILFKYVIDVLVNIKIGLKNKALRSALFGFREEKRKVCEKPKYNLIYSQN